MKNRYKKIIFSLVAIFFILLPQVSLAQGLKDAFGGSKSPLEEVRKQAGYDSKEDIGSISGRVINTALTLVAVIFLLLMVYAGYLWMTAQGEEAKVDKAINIVKGTVIGLVLVMSAYAITIFITKGLNPTTSTGGSCLPTTPPPTGVTCSTACNNTQGSNSAACAAIPTAGCCTWR